MIKLLKKSSKQIAKCEENIQIIDANKNIATATKLLKSKPYRDKLN